MSLLHEGLENPETGEVETLRQDRRRCSAPPSSSGGRSGTCARSTARPSRRPSLSFDVSFLFGGQIKGGPMRLYMIYAAGNFIECGQDAPFLQIGEHKYGKPILDRAVKFTTDHLRRAEDRPDLDGFDHALEPRRRAADRHRGHPPRQLRSSRGRAPHRGRASPISTTCASAGRRRCGPRTWRSLVRPTARAPPVPTRDSSQGSTTRPLLNRF